MTDPGPAPKLDYSRPEPRNRPAWADMLLVVLTAIAVLLVAFSPIIVFQFVFPLSENFICLVYGCLSVVMLIVAPRILKRVRRI